MTRRRVNVYKSTLLGVPCIAAPQAHRHPSLETSSECAIRQKQKRPCFASKTSSRDLGNSRFVAMTLMKF